MKKFTAVVFGLFFLTSSSVGADPLVITTTTDAAALAAAVAGAGVTVVSGSETLIGAATQQGTFTGGAGILPFDTGIILTSGAATAAPGPDNNPGFTAVTDTGSNAALSAVEGGGETFDQNVLTFNFIPTSNELSFQFVFASEEYHEFVNEGVNDVFAFFLNGANIALVPGTSTPISIDTINCDVNPAFYDPNSASSPCFNAAQAVNTQYDGLVGGLFATPLFATGAVNPGVANTIQIAIADVGDSVLDSAVFIAGSSFVAQPPPTEPPPGVIPEPASLTLLGLGLAGAAAQRYRRRS